MIDCHCHLADERLFSHLEDVLARCESRGLRYFIFGGVSPDEWERQEQIASRLPDRYAARTCFGLHPVWVAQASDEACKAAFTTLETKISAADALGETGLDFRKAWASPEALARQDYWFRAHLNLAGRTDKPLVLHVVHAHEAALGTCRDYSASGLRGVVHGFTGSQEIARKWLDLGFHISLGTRILYDNNHRLRDLAAWLPMDRLLVESDAPDQKPPGFPRQFNEPWTAVDVMETIAAAKHLSVGLVQARLVANAESLFGKFCLV